MTAQMEELMEELKHILVGEKINQFVNGEEIEIDENVIKTFDDDIADELEKQLKDMALDYVRENVNFRIMSNELKY